MTTASADTAAPAAAEAASAGDAAPAKRRMRWTAVKLWKVPRAAWRLKRLAINVAPLPVSIATRLAGGRRRRAPHIYTDERSLEKEASVLSGFFAFKPPLRRQAKARELPQTTVTQTGEIMGQALSASETFAARAAAELASAANVLSAAHAAFRAENPFGAGNGLDAWVPRVPQSKRPAPVGGGAPVVTQRGTLAPVRLEADVTLRQRVKFQRMAAGRLRAKRRAEKRRAAASGATAAAAASADVPPPPMASGRVLGSRGAEWGAVHPDAEALARTIAARAPTLQGWLQSIPAARAAVRAARQGAADAAPPEPLWAAKAEDSARARRAHVPRKPLEVVEAGSGRRAGRTRVTIDPDVAEVRGAWYARSLEWERAAAAKRAAWVALKAEAAGASGSGAASIGSPTAAPALAAAGAAGAHVLEATAVAGHVLGSGATSGAAAAGWPSAPARS